MLLQLNGSILRKDAYFAPSVSAKGFCLHFVKEVDGDPIIDTEIFLREAPSNGDPAILDAMSLFDLLGNVLTGKRNRDILYIVPGKTYPCLSLERIPNKKNWYNLELALAPMQDFWLLKMRFHELDNLHTAIIEYFAEGS